MRELRKAAIYCRNAETYGSFEPKGEHNTIAYQTGSAMTFITDNKLDFCGLYVDEMDSMSSLMALNRECKAGKIDAVIVRDLDVLWDNDMVLLWLEDSFPVAFIGAEDLDTTKGKLNPHTLEIEQDEEERHHSEEHKQAIQESADEYTKEKQEQGIYLGRIPYGYQKVGDDLVADPETAPIVSKIFELFIGGYKLNDIRRHLKGEGIKSPTGTEWNPPGVKRILQRETYLGGDHIQPLVSRENFDLANEMLTTKTIKKDDQEPDYFPMAVCGVCGKKLTFKRSRNIYLCDRHTGEFANEKKLKHAPKISVEDLKVAVVRQYNEQLADMKYFQDKPIWETDLCIDERGADKVKLGEKILALDPKSENYVEQVDDAAKEYEGLWIDWVQALRNCRDELYDALIRHNLPDAWRPMHGFDPRMIMHSVRLIRLKEDGTVEVHFNGERAFAGAGIPFGSNI